MERVTCTFNPNTSEFKASLGYKGKFQVGQGYTVRPCLTNKQKERAGLGRGSVGRLVVQGLGLSPLLHKLVRWPTPAVPELWRWRWQD